MTTKREIMETLEGNEIWSITYEGLITVTDGKIHVDYTGRVFTPTTQEARDLLDEAIYQEYGTTDMATIMRKEGF